LPEEPLTFESRDGVALSGILSTIEGNPKGGIILAHGIMTNKDYGGFYPALATELARHGFESLRFDFRGHGISAGKPADMTIAGEIEDLGAAVRVLSRRGRPVGIVGTSLGAGVAVLWAAKTRTPPFAMVLLSPVLDFRRTFLTPETAWGKKWFNPGVLEEATKSGSASVGGFAIGSELVREFETLRPLEDLRALPIPVLTVHGERDPIAPFAVAQEAASSRPGVKFIRIDVAAHYFEGHQPRVFQQISRWLDARAPA
jgi:alpha-beta hydrolase superfamily lysophospholipase